MIQLTGSTKTGDSFTGETYTENYKRWWQYRDARGCLFDSLEVPTFTQVEEPDPPSAEPEPRDVDTPIRQDQDRTDWEERREAIESYKRWWQYRDGGFPQ